MKAVFLVAALLGLTLLSGCDDPSLFGKAPGKYQGLVGARARNSAVRQIAVVGELKKVSDRVLNLDLTARRSGDRWQLVVTARDNDTVSLGDTELKRVDKACFASKKRDALPPATRLCFDGHELSIDDERDGAMFSLLMNKADDDRQPKMEQPAEYTAAQLVDRALSQNFTTRAEFERVVQAKLNAQIAAELLAPHVSMGTILGVVFNGWTSLFRAVGDLIPFVFPSRWIQAFEADLQFKAQQQALRVMRADTANIAESLAYLVERDERILARLESNHAEITVIRDEIRARERLNLAQAGASDDVTSLLNSIEKSNSAFRQFLAEEYAALSQVAGFYNPAAISKVHLSSAVSVDDPITFDPDTALEVALLRSHELNQMDLLIESAKLNQVERYFTWLDPSGGAQGSVGINMLSYFQVAGSQQRELAFKRENLKSLIVQKFTGVVGELAQSLEAYGLSHEGRIIQDRRVERVLSNMRLGIGFSMSELVSGLQDKVRSGIDELNSEFAYYVTVTKFNRLTYAGPYARTLNVEGSGRTSQ